MSKTKLDSSNKKKNRSLLGQSLPKDDRVQLLNQNIILALRDGYSFIKPLSSQSEKALTTGRKPCKGLINEGASLLTLQYLLMGMQSPYTKTGVMYGDKNVISSSIDSLWAEKENKAMGKNPSIYPLTSTLTGNHVSNQGIFAQAFRLGLGKRLQQETDFQEKSQNTNAHNFLAYWLLPFLGLVPLLAARQENKLLVPMMVQNRADKVFHKQKLSPGETRSELKESQLSLTSQNNQKLVDWASQKAFKTPAVTIDMAKLENRITSTYQNIFKLQDLQPNTFAIANVNQAFNSNSKGLTCSTSENHLPFGIPHRSITNWMSCPLETSQKESFDKDLWVGASPPTGRINLREAQIKALGISRVSNNLLTDIDSTYTLLSLPANLAKTSVTTTNCVDLAETSIPRLVSETPFFNTMPLSSQGKYQQRLPNTQPQQLSSFKTEAPTNLFENMLSQGTSFTNYIDFIKYKLSHPKIAALPAKSRGLPFISESLKTDIPVWIPWTRNIICPKTVPIENQNPKKETHIIPGNIVGATNLKKFTQNTSKIKEMSGNMGIILQHKKLHFIPLKVKQLDTVPLIYEPQSKLNLNSGQLEQQLGGNSQKVETLTSKRDYIFRKKEIQKKRKAKKLRLESRRQKKRKRFYPRPTWLRYRLAFETAKLRVPAVYSNSDWAAVNVNSFLTNIAGLNNSKLNQPFLDSPWQAAVRTANYNKILYNLLCYSAPSAGFPSWDLKFRTGKNTSLGVSAGLGENLTELPNKNREKNSNQFLMFRKTKANYAIVSPTKSPNQDQTQKTTFGLKDFWVWLYNLTSTNYYTKLLVLDNFLTPTPLSGPALLAPGKIKMDILHNGIKQPPAFEKKKREAGTLETKLQMEFKGKTALPALASTPLANMELLRMAWAGYNTNASHGFKNSRHQLWSIQKLRNQSKNNKTKLIQANLKTKYFNLFAPSFLGLGRAEQSLTGLRAGDKEANNWYPFGLQTRIYKKIHQKEHKLAYLTSLRPSIELATTTVQQLPKAVSTHQGFKKVGIYSPNFTWWSSFSPPPLAWEMVGSFKTVGFSLLFHFCALISLISISQIRSFIKFHLILLHKLSNFYLQMLYKPAKKVHCFPNMLHPSKGGSLDTLHFTNRSFITNTLLTLPPLSTGNKPHTKMLSSNQSKIRFLLASPSANLNSLYNSTGRFVNSENQNSQEKLAGRKQMRKDGNSQMLIKALRKELHKKRASSAFLKPLKGKVLEPTLSTIINIYLFEKQIDYNANKKAISLQLKKQSLAVSFKVVDTFESCLRLIYGFFEKPAEFTMDWIAYAFLIEWSSDLLAFTPLAFGKKEEWVMQSKIIRQNQLPITLVNNYSFESSLATQAAFFLPTFTLSQFITKRILYLNDLLLSVLYRPDTDLMSRQRKGALFWDIWSDYLIKAADKYNINVPSLSNIKEEQNVLLENFLTDTDLLGRYTSYPLSGNTISGQIDNNKTSYFKQPRRGYPTPDIFKRTNGSWEASSLALSYPKSETLPSIDLNIAQQFITYQSKETDLFLDYNLPKSFSHISAIKYYTQVQQPMGTLVCQIYSGIFSKQIAKNVLVINSALKSNALLGPSEQQENMQKTLLIQALAGETEIKMITENSSRYALGSGGFAVGIKYLKEVFDAITLNTPCLFLLEDIHLIGERRPLLISDHGDSFGNSDSMSKGIESAFGSTSAEAQAVHEKNQILAKYSRHTITHFHKYKGDYSLSIPSNHFAFDLFLKTRHNSSIPTYPLSYSLNKAKSFTTSTSSSTPYSPSKKSSADQQILIASSALQLNKHKSLLSPPSTSPFSVLLLKEQKKLKPKKVVKELSWAGLPSEQLSLLPRVSFSVRAKVAALAELGFTNVSAKIDMITDLLVIIDSVRGHRGFVVFATTHLPHVLDPALRRPGRLDETISLPTISNLWTRWEFSEFSVFKKITQLQDLTLINSFEFANRRHFASIYDTTSSLNIWKKNQVLSGISPQGSHNLAQTQTNNGFYIQNYNTLDGMDFLPTEGSYSILSNSLFSPILKGSLKAQKAFSQYQQSQLPSYPWGSKPVDLLTKQIAYFQMGKKLVWDNNKSAQAKNKGRVRFRTDGTHFSPIYLNKTAQKSSNVLSDFLGDFSIHANTESLKFTSLYSSPTHIQMSLMSLLAGKFTESFALKTLSVSSQTKNTQYISNEFATALTNPKFISVYGIDNTWRAATSLALSFVQKRYLFNQNLITAKLLQFLDSSVLEEPPSPPASNILIPAKRYENAQKVLKNQIQAWHRNVPLSQSERSFIQDKLQAHTKQAFIKSIYNVNKSQSLASANNLVNVGSLTLGGKSSSLLQPTNVQNYYSTKILQRHRIALNNLWWNGQLLEHSAETLFFSDIDWRLTNLKGNKSLSGRSTTNFTTEDILIDFPDSDQHYNPKHRRWLLTSGYWMSWFGQQAGLEKDLQNQLFDHLILEAGCTLYETLNENREFLDFSVAKFLKKGLIKELSFFVNLQKFK